MTITPPAQQRVRDYHMAVMCWVVLCCATSNGFWTYCFIIVTGVHFFNCFSLFSFYLSFHPLHNNARTHARAYTHTTRQSVRRLYFSPHPTPRPFHFAQRDCGPFLVRMHECTHTTCFPARFMCPYLFFKRNFEIKELKKNYNNNHINYFIKNYNVRFNQKRKRYCIKRNVGNNKCWEIKRCLRFESSWN